MALRILALALLLVCTSGTLADNVYIRDTLYVPLRSGQSMEYKILHQGLRSGTELERLEINEESGYSRVRTNGGLEGWLPSQYLMKEPTARVQLAEVQARLEKLEAQYQQNLLRLQEASKFSQTADTLAIENEQLTQELQRITELAANTLAIDEENKALKKDRDKVLQRLERLREKNQTLADNQAQKWFLGGGVMVMISLLFGFWVARRIYHRRKFSGWT